MMISIGSDAALSLLDRVTRTWTDGDLVRRMFGEVRWQCPSISFGGFKKVDTGKSNDSTEDWLD
jgi:hypothetical protein